MEIDLNHAVNEVDKNACGNGDECDKKGGGSCVYCCLSSSTSSCSSNAASSSPPCSKSIYMELWNACAGPLTRLPKKGNVVVYFPQGHLEQGTPAPTPSPPPYPPMEMPNFDLPPQIFCRVVDVQLLANKENDEVYTQLALLPVPELVGVKLEGKESESVGVDEDANRVALAKSTSHMFCKTLTASDTSTHGGFSVPRRAAEDCFPPLDYKEQRPSQELIAKDLHGVEWRFRHIYRGQPRRHLLTTGWSIFVSQKSLVAGDAVLFLRGEGGELRLGIRRAARPRNGLPESVIKNQNSYTSVLSPVANALSVNGTFHVFYSPRASHADFIVPYQKYVKSSSGQIPVGTRFKMRFDLDDSPERRFRGVVSGVGNLDPYRWPNSKWRCLMVRWDDDVMSTHQERVSPWDIDFSGNYAALSLQSSPRMKKLRSSLQEAPYGSPNAGRGAFLDFEESLSSSKVLQGQENVGFVSPLYRRDTVNHQSDFQLQPTAPNPVPNRMEKFNYGELVRNFNSGPAATFTGFLESNWFPKVLQGQEICSFRSLTGKTDTNLGAWSKPELGCNFYNNFPKSSPVFYPLASEGARSMQFPQKGILGARQNPLLLSSFPNSQTGHHLLNPASILSGVSVDVGRVPHPGNEPRALGKRSAPETSVMNVKTINDDNNLKENVPTCKVFGFSLTEDPIAFNSKAQSKRSCTKVHKQGSLVGRAIYLSKLHGYDDLLIELERLFGMEGLLRDRNSEWRILYTDSENDMMVVGDDPWHEFVEVVSKIHIYTQEEVEKLSIGVNNSSDDTHSCLEEAPALPDMSTSPSVGQPDSSSPTTVRM